MRRGIVGSALAMLLAVGAIAPGAAEPTLDGYSGLIYAPSASVLGPNEFNIGFSTAKLTSFDKRSFAFNYGLQNGLEAGVLWWRPDGGPSETAINLKHRFAAALGEGTSLAVGVADVTDQIGRSVYVVGSKEFGRTVGTLRGQPVRLGRVHAGLGSGRLDGFFFGAEANLGTRMTMMAELVNDELNLGARLRLWRNVTVDAALLDVSDLAVGVSINYPLGRARDLDPILTDEPASQPSAAETSESTQPTQSAGEQQTSTTAPETVAAAPGSVDAVERQLPPAEPSDGQEAGTTGEPVEDWETAGAAVDEPAASTSAPTDKPIFDIPLRGMPLVVSDGDMFVPLRPVADWLGFEVEARYAAQKMRVTVDTGRRMVRFAVGDDTVTVDGLRAPLSAATYLHNREVTMVPTDFFPLLGVPTEVDRQSQVVLLEREDAIGQVMAGK